MRSSIYVLFTAIVLLTSQPHAKQIEISTGDVRAKDVNITVIESDQSRTVIQFDINGYDQQEVALNGKTYHSISAKELVNNFSQGLPDLPRSYQNIVIPHGATPTVKIIDVEFLEIADMTIAPVDGQLPELNDRTFESGRTVSDQQWLPAEIVVSGEPFVMRDVQGVTISISPFQYDQVRKILRVNKSITIEIIHQAVSSASTVDKPVIETFETIYKEHFLNYSSAALSTETIPSTGDMLIIVADNLYATMAPFVEWKMQKGIDIIMTRVSEIGGVPEIQAYVSGIYFDDTDNFDLAYLLLVGGDNTISAPLGGYNDASGGDATNLCDPIYARMTEDLYPDIIVGRFPGKQIWQLETAIERSIHYERDIVDNNGSADWLAKTIGISYRQTHMQDILNKLEIYGYTSDDLLWAAENASPQPSYVSEINLALNEGRGLVNYASHGSETGWWTSGYNTTHIDNLENAYKLPMVVSIGCNNGDFSFYRCMAEAWITARDDNQDPVGAVAAIMNSGVSSSSVGPVALDIFINALTSGLYKTFGGLGFYSLYKLVLYGDIRNSEVWTVFGDPSLMVRTKVPAGFVVEHPTEIEWDATSFSVMVYESDGITPVSSITCAIYCGGTLHGTAKTGNVFTGDNGLATIQLLPSSTLLCNQAKITVTGFNRETVQHDIQVNHALAIGTTPFEDSWNSNERVIESNGYLVECDVFTQSSLVGSPSISYSVDNVPSLLPALMSNVSGTLYNGYIPLAAAGETISYSISASNVNGDTHTTPIYTFLVRDYAVALTVVDDTLSNCLDAEVWFDLKVTNSGTLDDNFSLSIQNNNWNTTIFDEAGVNIITESPQLSMDEFYLFRVRVEIGSGVEGELDECSIIATSTSNPIYVADVTLQSVSTGISYELPLIDNFSGTEMDETIWDGFFFDGEFNYIATDALYNGNSGCEANALHLNSALRPVTTKQYNLSDETKAYALFYWYQKTGPGNSPEFGDDLVVQYRNKTGNWYELGRENYLKDMDYFYRVRYEIPYYGLHTGFLMKFEALSTNTAGQAGSDDPIGHITLEGYDDWYVDNIYLTEVPRLLSPASGTESTIYAPTLTWQPYNDAILYQLEIVQGTNWNATLHAAIETAETSWTITPNLLTSEYSWRVRASSDGTTWSEWSASWLYTRIPVPSNPPSCPVLYTYKDSKYIEENPLLTACEASNYTEVVTDYYLVPEVELSSDGIVKFQLRELENEITSLESLELISVDHDPASYVACSMDGRINTYLSATTPVTAVDHRGVDVLPAVGATDRNFYQSDEPGYIIVTFPANSGKGTGFTIASAMKPLCRPITKSLANGKIELNEIIVDILDENGEWMTLTDNIPLRTNHTNEIVAADLSELMVTSGVTMRVSWSEYYATDVINMVVPADETPSIVRHEMQHNWFEGSEGVAKSWVGGQASPLLMTKGDMLEFEFKTGEVPSGKKRDYIIVATGKYEPDYSVYTLLTPNSYKLYNNYPNPFNPTTTIAYDLPQSSSVKLEVINLLGQVVVTLIDKVQDAGHQEVKWNAQNVSGMRVASGIYFYRLTTETFTESKKMLLVK